MVIGRAHRTDYDATATDRCERVLLTLLGDLGPWRERVYLAGGLAPRYLIGQLPEGARPHVGTTDVDLIIGLTVGDEAPETYRTLQNNLIRSGFRQREPSFRWSRQVEEFTVLVEFLCETDQVEPGQVFRPKDFTGSKLGAFNVPGAQLVRDDYVEHAIEGERLDGGQSKVFVRVANILPTPCSRLSRSKTATRTRTPTISSSRCCIVTAGHAALGARQQPAPSATTRT